ncbi:carbon-nitrogen hydrolase family protein [Sulfurospirillum sp. 1307]|jgi:predicted amidohydrolase
MTFNPTLVALQFNYENRSLEENFKTLLRLIKLTKEDSIILAPELCLSGYKYDSLDISAQFSKEAIPKLLELSKDRTLALTLIEKENDKYLNNLYIFSYGKIVQKRAKAKLFPLGDEPKYFTSGKEEEIQTVEIKGIKIATLICFELRFTKLWDRISGADVILIPSFWGMPRKEHLKALSTALAIANQAFVIVSNSSDESMASSSGIITPFGDIYRDDSSFIIKKNFDSREIKKMRRYVNIGL